MLVLERRIGEELVFSTGLRLRVLALRGDRVRLRLTWPGAATVVSSPMNRLLMLEAGIQIRLQRRGARRVSMAIDAPVEVRVFRSELVEPKLAAGRGASGICCAGSR
jgi:sRNA-binding carbon storage regulator CsrA